MRQKIAVKLLKVDWSFEAGQAVVFQLLAYVLAGALWNWWIAALMLWAVIIITAVATPLAEYLCHYTGWQLSEEKMYRENPDA